MLTTLILAGMAVAVLAGHKKASGVGAVKKAKRRVYREIAVAQNNGIDLSMSFDMFNESSRLFLEDLGRKYGWKQSAASVRAGKSYAEAYFINLKKAYSAISGVGTTTLPYKESIVYNDNGDEIMRYRDYGSEAQKMHDALVWYGDRAYDISLSNPEEYGYMSTVLAIATGTKFVWKGKKQDGMYVYLGILEELFGTGEGKYNTSESHNEERKKRISYLGSKEKGAVSPAAFVESLEFVDKMLDYADQHHQDIQAGVHQALLEFTSVGEAREDIMRTYINEHTNEEYADEHVPF